MTVHPSPDDASHHDVVVLGGGIAGLATAWYAAKRGVRVCVLEREPVVGGMARSMEVSGQQVDVGSHRLHASIRADLLDDLRSLLGDTLQWRQREGRIRLQGRWLAFPLRPVDLVAHAPPSFTARVSWDMMRAPLRRGAPRDTFGACVRAGFGPTVAETFYEPYARKLWATEAAELSAELFRRRVPARSGGALARRMLRRERPGFWYPATGFGAIVDAIAADVRMRGGEIRTGAHVARLVPSASGCDVELADGERLVARTVVSTVPSRVLTVLCSAPPEVEAAAAALRHRGAVFVYLTVPRASYGSAATHYFPEPNVVLSRLSEPKRYRDGVSDPRDLTVLCAEIPADVGDAMWAMEDDVLARHVRDDLVACSLPDPLTTHVHVVRQPHVYPVYRTGFEVHQQVVERWADTQPNVVQLGRQALFAHDNTHHALSMAKAFEACLDDHGVVDRNSWAQARRSFADHVVED